MTKSNAKYLINLFVLLFFLLMACNEKNTEKVNFCERFEADQSNLSRGHMSEAEKKERRTKRLADIKKNLGIINSLIKSDELSEVKKDTCYKLFLMATLVHNAQNFPEEIFNKKMIASLKKEVDKDNIPVDYLRSSLSSYKKYTPEKKRCKEMKEMVDYAISTWKVNENYEQSINGKIENIEYVDCNKKK